MGNIALNQDMAIQEFNRAADYYGFALLTEEQASTLMKEEDDQNVLIVKAFLTRIMSGKIEVADDGVVSLNLAKPLKVGDNNINSLTFSVPTAGDLRRINTKMDEIEMVVKLAARLTKTGDEIFNSMRIPDFRALTDTTSLFFAQ